MEERSSPSRTPPSQETDNESKGETPLSSDIHMLPESQIKKSSQETENSQMLAQRPSPTWLLLWMPSPPSTMAEKQNDTPQRRDREGQNLMPDNHSDISTTLNLNLHSPSARWWTLSPQSSACSSRSTISSGLQSLMPFSSFPRQRGLLQCSPL